MKKIYFFSIAFFLLKANYLAQPGCPSVYAGADVNLECVGSCTNLVADPFKTGESTSYTVSSITYNPPVGFNQGTPAFIGIDDVWGDVITLPFNFCFFGNTYNQLVIGANGLISFDLTYANGFCPWSYSASIPNAGLPLNSISGAYHDIDPSVCGNIYYGVFGTAPCRMFVVNFDQVCHFSCNSLQTTQQIVLYETTNAIEVYIQNKPTCTTWNSGNALIGIQNATGTVGYTPPGRNTGPWSASNEGWRFTPDGAPNYTITWFEAGNATPLATTDTLNVCPMDTTQYVAQVIYTNCDGSQVIVTDTVVVNVSGGLSAQPTSNSPLCEGNDLSLTSLPGAQQYSWTGPNGFISNQQNATIPSAGPSATGWYFLSSVDALGGTCIDSIFVQINVSPTADFISNSPICNEDSLVLNENASVSPPETISSYQWNIFNLNASYNVSSTQPDTTLSLPSAGIYTVIFTVESSNGCKDSVIATVTKSPNPIANFQYVAQCFQQNAFVDQTTSGTPPFTYAWYLNSDSIVDETLPSFTYTFPDTADQFVTLVVTDSLGCVSDTTMLVQVKEGVTAPVMPNILVQNSVSGNDKFDFQVFAPGFNECITYTLSIFNRWGIKVFETINNANNPDLQCNDCFTGLSETGSQLVPGVYYYVLKGSNDIELNGTIHIFE